MLCLSKTLTACTLAAATIAASAAPVYSLAGDDAGATVSLIRFDSQRPGSSFTVIGQINGAVSALDGLDFRPANGKLYGYLSAQLNDDGTSAGVSGVYEVDPLTAATRLVSPAAVPIENFLLGTDFNPQRDRLRVVGVDGDNHRIDVDGGVTRVDGRLAYAAGDVNEGKTAGIIEAAYTNNINGASSTQLYYIDYLLDALVTTDDPNAGLLRTVGALGIDIQEDTGFDIVTDAAGHNTAIATFRTALGNDAFTDGFYAVDLTTGAARLIADLGNRHLFGLTAAFVPEPAVWSMLALAAVAAFAGRRRPAAGDRKAVAG